jgi:CRP-like cAMP-binding protein
MENTLIAYFSRFSAFTEEEKAAILRNMVTKKYPKGAHIRKEGQYSSDTFFVLEGLVRQYRLVAGEEISTNFFSESQWIISLSGFSPDNRVSDYLICLEDTTVVVGNEAAAQRIFREFPRFETIARAVMEQVFAEQQTFLSSFQTNTPGQRYARLLESNPGLFQRVPQYYIASYLGVKPESLSRIRKRYANK